MSKVALPSKVDQEVKDRIDQIASRTARSRNNVTELLLKEAIKLADRDKDFIYGMGRAEVR